MPGPLDTFVGRQAELNRLGIWLRQGASGLVLVGGEAGIGKTRLLREALDRSGRAAVWSAGWEGDGAPVYWPWIQLIRALLASPEGVAWAAGAPSAPDVLALLPEQVDFSLGVDASQFRLFEAVADLVGTVVATAGPVLVFDDLQWVDESSLRLLAFVVRLLRDRVLIAGTYRDDEVLAGHPLVRARADLAGDVRQLPLAGLGPDDLGALIRGEFPELASRDVDEWHRMTGGNPFFAREVLALNETVAPRPTRRPTVPTGVQIVIERRLARLSNDAADALKMAAVFGSSFRNGDLAAAVGWTEATCWPLLTEAIDAHIVEPDPAGPGRFRFSHDLFRETIYAAIGPLERARAHARLVDILESLPGRDAHVEMIAHHSIEAAAVLEPGRIAAAAHRAGDRALALLADEEAAEWYSRALVALRVGRSEPAEELEILLALGEAHARQGDLPAARAAYLEAADRAWAESRPNDVARAALGLGAGLGGFEIALFDEVQIELLERALAVIPLGDSAARAQLLARLSVAVSFVQDDDRRLALSESAIAMARRVDDGVALGHALAANCDSLSGPEFSERRRVAAEEIVGLATAAGDRRLELLGRRHLINALLELGAIADADRQITLYALAADALREPMYRWYVPLWKGMRALMAGRIAESAALCEEAKALGQLAQSTNAEMLEATQRWVRTRVEGRLPEAAFLLSSEGAEIFGTLPGGTVLDALRLLHEGRVEAAGVAMAGLIEQLPRLPRDAEWLPTMAQAAEVVAAVGDRTAAEVVEDLMRPFDHRVVVEGIGAAVYGTLGGFRAPLAALLGRPDEAARLAAEAAAAACAMGLRSTVALVAPRGAAPAPVTDRAEGRIGRDGDIWTLTFADVTARVRDSKGLRDLGVLLTRPGVAVHVSELMRVEGPVSHGTPALDRRALSEYRRRLAELDEELSEADRHRDPARSDKLAAEREFLLVELSGNLGLGGQVRRAGDDVDRARKAVRARIRDAIGRIEAVHPALGRHLTAAVRTGAYCSYEPEHAVKWRAG